MAGYREPNFNERTAAAAKAREAALAKLKAKPKADPAELARLNAERIVREAAEAEARAAAKAAREAAKAAQEAEKAAAHAAAEAERIAAEEAGKKPEVSDEEKKAIRDAKYAARKQRKGKR